MGEKAENGIIERASSALTGERDNADTVVPEGGDSAEEVDPDMEKETETVESDEDDGAEADEPDMEESAEAGKTLDLDFSDRDRTGSGEIFDSEGDSDGIAEPDLADEVPKPALNREVATFSFEKGPVSVKITPQSSQEGLNWTISIYSRGVQGPLLQSSEPLSREQAVEVGLDEKTRERINTALEFAQAELSLPPTFRSETPKKSLSDLERLMEERDGLFKT